jgi:hypothetical protein
MNSSFHYTTALQYRLKDLEHQVAQFRSGEKYRQMEELRRKDIQDYSRQIKKLEAELSRSHSIIISVRNQWFKEYEILIKDHNKETALLHKEIFRLQKLVYEAQHQRDEALDQVTALRRELKAKEEELQEEKDRNQKFRAQLSRGSDNSSIPSSKDKPGKKVSNSREKTGRKPGAQEGHPAHGRKRLDPTKIVQLEEPKEVQEDPAFRKTPKEIVKQNIEIHLSVDVTELHSFVWRNTETGERIHSAFPEGVVDDVNYGESISAFLFLLTQDCCVSIDKSRRFLKELTGGKLDISKGMIAKLTRRFSDRSKEDLDKVFQELLVTPVLHTDMTNARFNGENAYVSVCAAPNGTALYNAHTSKGFRGIDETVVKNFGGTLVHDHDTAYYHYASEHQECIAHVLRYLKDSMQNEPWLTWNSQMHSLLQEMIHYRKTLPEDTVLDPSKIQELEQKYDAILELAGKEYTEHPPGKYYRDGINLARRMKQYRKEHLLFLENPDVPATNNLSERLLRQFKRKQQQAVSFRSFESLEDLCECMSMLALLRLEGEADFYSKVSSLFTRKAEPVNSQLSESV